jgi:hypothetical protein
VLAAASLAAASLAAAASLKYQNSGLAQQIEDFWRRKAHFAEVPTSIGAKAPYNVHDEGEGLVR